uniref:acetyltransferase n=1 Tax=Eubacterium cellulosolvens TaxID=29322 RepID=UPI0006873B32|nr:acetyltransferase [[Eubacterium] cellulosolvens]
MGGDSRNRLIIIGAGGHGKVVADIAKRKGYEDIVFLDNDTSVKECFGYPVIGPDTRDRELEGDLFVAVGNPFIRMKLMERNKERSFPTLIHPDAVIADDTEIGGGTVVMAGTVVNPGTKIGMGCIVNTSASVDHDCIVGDYSHISVGAHLCGTVKIGNRVWVGAGATVSNNVNICPDITIGAGAVVIHNIEEKGIYIGVPAKRSNKSHMTEGGASPPEQI